MNRKPIFALISPFLMIILISNGNYVVNGFTSVLTTQNLEWGVEIGNSRTYIYETFYNILESIPNQYRVSGTDENGQVISVIVNKDTKLKYTITSIPAKGSLKGEITYNSNVTLIEEPIPTNIIIKTYDDKSYWENNESFSIQGNQLVQTTRSSDVYYNEEEGQAFPYELTTNYKWDWKTGWLAFFHIRSSSFEGETYYEEKFEVTGEKSVNGQLQSNVIFGTVFLGMIVIILVTEKKIIKRYK
ncbi:MAG: hypothetical protein ACXADY_16685 [Candidatus Hodarchaeales archaeon]|jgi:hypothetical protein